MIGGFWKTTAQVPWANSMIVGEKIHVGLRPSFTYSFEMRRDVEVESNMYYLRSFGLYLHPPIRAMSTRTSIFGTCPSADEITSWDSGLALVLRG